MRNEHIVVLSDKFEGKRISLTGKIAIGRNPDNELQLDDLQVSRKHATIEQRENATFLKDLGSENGTYVDGLRILEYKLKDGDIAQIGNQQLRFEVDKDAPVEETPREMGNVRFNTAPEGKVSSVDAGNVYETFFQAPSTDPTEKQLHDTQKRLRAIYDANQAISSEQNLTKVFEKVMDQIFALMPAHNGVILLNKPKSAELVTEYVKSGLNNEDVIVSSTIAKRAYENGEAIITYDADDDLRFKTGASIISQNISSAMCVPLTHQEERLGLIYVDTRGTTNAFGNSDLELLVALSASSAIAIKNAQYLHMLEQSYEDTLTVLATTIEMRDHYTVGHTWRVTNFSLEIARELGWSDEKLQEVRKGGVMHDIGKIAIDDAILRKPDKLTDEEYDKIKVHPERGAQLLQDVEFLHPLIPYCLYHHERFDGKGYPNGLEGEDIPIEGRLVAVADTFDAMTSHRPYRRGLDPDVAIEEIEKCKGSQFDPVCADAMIRCYREGRIHRILQDYHKKDGRNIACPFCSTHLRLDEEDGDGAIVSCEVCRRKVRVVSKHDTFFGELLPQSSAGSHHTHTRAIKN